MTRTVRFIFLILVLGLQACMPQAIRDQQAFEEQYLNNNSELQHLVIDLPELSEPQQHAKLHAVLAERSGSSSENAAIVFIHGTPGDWRNAGYYLLAEQLRDKAHVLSLDRLGWGASLPGATDSARFTVQAAAIAELLKTLRNDWQVKHIILAGHSLGASIAPQVAMDFPELVDGLLLLAGTLDPELAGPRWFNRLATIPGVYYLLPKELVRSNKEIMSLHTNLAAMRSGWAQLKIPVHAVQGMQDGLVYPANIDFIDTVLQPPQLRSIRLEHAGHLINLEHQDLVITELLDLLTIVSNR